MEVKEGSAWELLFIGLILLICAPFYGIYHLVFGRRSVPDYPDYENTDDWRNDDWDLY